MQRSYKNNSIPDLRRKTHYKGEINMHDLRYLAIRYSVIGMILVAVIITSLMIVAASPNSNFPVNM